MDLKLFCGDCLNILKQIPDGSVDMICTDPPYNISQDREALDRSNFKSRQMRRSAKVTLDFGDWDKSERRNFIFFGSGGASRPNETADGEARMFSYCKGES